MTSLLKAAQKARRHVGTEDHFLNASTSWPSTSQCGDFSSYLTRRVVPSISIIYVLLENNFWSFDKLIWYCSRAAECLTHLCSCEFFLDLWGRSLRGPLIHALWLPARLHRFVWISPGLWFCDRSEIELKSSRFLHVAWSHPTLAGMKLLICCSQQSYPCS
jgi:hypothetical protein